MSDAIANKNSVISRENRPSARINIPSLGTIVSAAVIIFLVYAFFSGLSYQFYASFLFLFYGVTKSMWVSVMLLGVFQTLLMIPFRIIRILTTNNTKEFQRTVEKMEDHKAQSFTLRSRFRQGNATFLFYAVDFIMQLVSYISMGRLFLTDFYSRHIDPTALYNWVPDPLYPIRDTFFKLPYPHITETLDLGWKVVVPVWIALVVVQVGILVARRTIRAKQGQSAATEAFSGSWSRYATGYLIFFMVVAYLIVRHFPVGWAVSIFSGDVSIPNRTFNTVTAVATFLVLVYHGIPRILRKGRMAETLGINQRVIETTQKQMFKETLFSAGLIGLGAFFITNRIPSAFELSIFTLEVISLAAPFTLDKIVLKGVNIAKGEEDSDADVLHQFGEPEKSEDTEAATDKPSTEAKNNSVN